MSNSVFKRPWNTKKRGLVEFLVYREGKRFIGVCLTFDIIEEGEDPDSVMRSIEEAARLHLDVVTKENMRDELLNRYAPKKYWDKYLALQKSLSRKKPEALQMRSASITSTATVSYPYWNPETHSNRMRIAG